MSENRVRYREGQNLRRQDLLDEQSYRIATRRRHNIAQHGWGIACGLELRPVETKRAVTLDPGFAVDGYGRELAVPQPLLLDPSVFDQVFGTANGLGLVDVWLTYGERAGDGLPGGENTRIAEEALLMLQTADADTPPTPRHPPGVPAAAAPFGPESDAPGQAEQEWPVYLGRVNVKDAACEVLMAGQRPYAGLVGASVNAPWGQQWMQIGDEEARDGRCFAISLAGQDGENIDRLALDRNGDATLRGQVRLGKAQQETLDGDGHLLLLAAGADPAAKAGGLLLEALAAAPEAPAPWQMYASAPKNPALAEQLRFELYDPGKDGDPALCQWVVGVDAAFEEAGKTSHRFEPCLTVRADGTVIVSKNLVIGGQLIEGEIPLDLEDQRFRDELLKRWSKGLTVAGAEVDALYELPLKIDIQLPPSGAAGANIQFSASLSTTDSTIQIPILAVIAEFRDANRLLIGSQSLAPLPEPVSAANPRTVTATVQFATPGLVTLAVRVMALGAAQNAVEKNASAMINIT